MCLKLALLLFYVVRVISENGYCRSSGKTCVNSSDCDDLECIPLSFYKELLDNNNTISCEDDEYDAHYPVLILPRINLKIYKQGNATEVQKLIKLFDEYLHTFSTISLYGHGIDDEIFDQLFVSGKTFFDKTLEYKMKYKTSNLGNSGYDPWKWISAARGHGIHDHPLDLTAAFSRYNHDGINGTYGPRNCPDYLLTSSNIYIPKIMNVLHTVHEIAALALGLDVNYFNDLHRINPSYHVRWLHYPALNLSNIEHRAKRLSGHTDYLGFNIFLPGKTRGLQMKILGNDLWIDVKTKHEYDLVLNIGQLYNIWTNNHWKANIHRVIPVSRERFTLSFFSGPDQEVIVEQIKECSKCNQNEPIFTPRMAKDHAKMTYSSGRTFHSDEDTFYS